jgi:hypothetical protein
MYLHMYIMYMYYKLSNYIASETYSMEIRLKTVVTCTRVLPGQAKDSTQVDSIACSGLHTWRQKSNNGYDAV